MLVITKDKKQINLPENATGVDLANQLHQTAADQALAIVINGVTKDLVTPLCEGDEVELLTFADPRGKELYWHTSAHIMAQAVLRLWPDAQPTIGPPIKNGFYYDFANLTISEEDFAKIDEEAAKIIAENHHPVRYVFKDKKEALDRFASNRYKTELISEFDGMITGYGQGEFFDLCRGPHLPALKKVRAFRTLKTSGAYWRGKSDQEMLTRIYGITFPSKKELDEYLRLIEEAKKRDHKVVGPKLGLFSLKEEAPGMPFIHPKGMVMWNALLKLWREVHREADYVEIKTPQIMTRELWKRSGHWDNYYENMYPLEIDTREYAIKPMNCPGCMLFYATDIHSYRELPLRIAEIGHVHRYEASGALSGLFRVRAFHQDDAHTFMLPSQIKQEIRGVLDIVDEIYTVFGLKYKLELSTRPEKSIGTDEDWETATNGLRDALDEMGMEYRINPGDGAFYGPKIDVHIEDALGRTWQCATIQLDMSLPCRFELKYIDSDGTEKRPVMIHRVIFGSIERFLGILIEHFAGRFPLWVSPHHVRVIPVSEDFLEYAREIEAQVKAIGLMSDVDASSDSFGKKIRNAQIEQINYMLIVGEKERNNRTINIRTRTNQTSEKSLEEFLNVVRKEFDERLLESPFEKKE